MLREGLLAYIETFQRTSKASEESKRKGEVEEAGNAVSVCMVTPEAGSTTLYMSNSMNSENVH